LTSDETEELRAFLLDHVSSFEGLEVLLFFERAPRRGWSVSDLAAGLDISDELVQVALDELIGARAPIESIGAPSNKSYRYVASGQDERLLAALQRAYDERRVTVLKLMSSNAVERVRSAAARRLADAFRLDRSKN
jgi:hypothetical protein